MPLHTLSSPGHLHSFGNILQDFIPVGLHMPEGVAGSQKASLVMSNVLVESPAGVALMLRR